MATKIKSIDKIMGVKTVDPSFEKYFVVLRDNRRVSDSNHTTTDSATVEMKYWEGIIERNPDGTRMSIIECDNPNFKG